MILRKGSFGLHAQPEFLRKRTTCARTMSAPSSPLTRPPTLPERAQSQPESDKDHERLPARSAGRPLLESVP